jgi:glucan 1,3-beta-glucosidase
MGTGALFFAISLSTGLYLSSILKESHAASVNGSLTGSMPRRPFLFPYRSANFSKRSKVNSTFSLLLAQVHTPDNPPLSNPFWLPGTVCKFGRIRKHMTAEKAVVFHDGFNFSVWKDFMQKEEFENIILDTHQYLMMAEIDGCPQNVEGYVTYVKEKYEASIKEMAQYCSVICGEWSLFNSLVCGHDTKGGQSVLNGIEGMEKESYTPEEKKEIYEELAKVQLDSWNCGKGYFYWNYKLLLDTVNEPVWIGWDSWDFGKSAAQGWFPVEHV